jgi:hypothetical protein
MASKDEVQQLPWGRVGPEQTEEAFEIMRREALGIIDNQHERCAMWLFGV